MKIFQWSKLFNNKSIITRVIMKTSLPLFLMPRAMFLSKSPKLHQASDKKRSNQYPGSRFHLLQICHNPFQSLSEFLSAKLVSTTYAAAQFFTAGAETAGYPVEAGFSTVNETHRVNELSVLKRFRKWTWTGWKLHDPWYFVTLLDMISKDIDTRARYFER